MNIFKPKDFYPIGFNLGDENRDIIANIANKILNDFLATCPVVYFGYHEDKMCDMGLEIKGRTMKARLVDIQPIEQEKLTITKDQLIKALNESYHDNTIIYADVAKRLGFK